MISHVEVMQIQCDEVLGDVHVSCRARTVGNAVLAGDTVLYLEYGTVSDRNTVFRTVCVVAMELPP